MSSTTQVSTISASVESISHMLALRQRLKKTDPKYRDSFGRRSFERRTSFGTLVGWRATGRAEQVWTHLRESLVSLIQDKRDQWEVKRAKSKPLEVGPAEPLFLLQCFLLGVDKEHATPHVCILCDIKWFSAAVRDIIVDSQLLSTNGWGCIRLPYTVALLGSGQDDAFDRSWGSRSEALAEYQVFACSDDLASGYLNGVPIEIKRGGTMVGKACIGGVISSGEEVFGLTVAHVFEDQHRIQPHSPAEADERLVDIDEDELEIFGSGDDAISSGSFFSDPASDELPGEITTTTETRGPAEDIAPNTRTGLAVLIGHLYELPQNRSSDWALLKLSSTFFFHHENLLPRLADAEGLTIFSPSGSRHGSVVSNAVVGLGYPPKPREVTVVSMDKSLPMRGDCGSWAFQSDRQAFVGMLVASCSAMNEAYLISLDEVLMELRVKSGLAFAFGPIVSAVRSSQTLAPSYLRTALASWGGSLRRPGEDVSSDSGFGSYYAQSRAPSVSTSKLDDLEAVSQYSASVLTDDFHPPDLQPGEREWTDLNALQEAYRAVYVSKDYWKLKAGEAEKQIVHYRHRLEELEELHRNAAGLGEPRDDRNLEVSEGVPDPKDQQWYDLEALQKEYQKVLDTRDKWEAEARQLGSDLAGVRKDEKEATARWRSVVNRNEILENEKQQLLQDKKTLTDKVKELKRQFGEFEASRYSGLRNATPYDRIRSGSKQDVTKESKEGLAKRFEKQDEDYESKSLSSGLESRLRRPSQFRQSILTTEPSRVTSKRRPSLSVALEEPTSTPSESGPTSSDTEPYPIRPVTRDFAFPRSGHSSIIPEMPGDLYEDDGIYHPYPLPSGRPTRVSVSKRGFSTVDPLLPPSRWTNEDKGSTQDHEDKGSTQDREAGGDGGPGLKYEVPRTRKV